MLDERHWFKSSSISAATHQPTSRRDSLVLRPPLKWASSSVNGGNAVKKRFQGKNHNYGIRHSIREKSGGFFLRARLAGQRRQRNRLVQKTGVCNISLVNVPRQSSRFLSDIFTTVVDIQWRWCLALFFCSYIITWALFTLVFYVTAWLHDDLHSPPPLHNPCIKNAHGLIALLMFSIESQSTIGYGVRYPTEECAAVMATVCLQNMVGCLMQTLMAGIVFAKLARPKKRAETIMFSSQAVISMRDGRLCLLFRVGDMRKSQLAEAHIRLQMIKKLSTREGELLPFHQFDMDVGYDCGLDRVLVMWPITVCHVIDEHSPLYAVDRQQLASSRFEVIAILEGVAESTGSTVQARTSYLPHEILWGHRYQKLVSYQRDDGDYRIDYGLFNSTYMVSCPPYSAKQLDDMTGAGLDVYADVGVVPAHQGDIRDIRISVEDDGKSTMENPTCVAAVSKKPSRDEISSRLSVATAAIASKVRKISHVKSAPQTAPLLTEAPPYDRDRDSEEEEEQEQQTNELTIQSTRLHTALQMGMVVDGWSSRRGRRSSLDGNAL